METTVKNGQTLLDMALQIGGSLESLFDLALMNGLSVTGDVGGFLKNTPVLNKQVVRFYQTGGLYPVTMYSGLSINWGLTLNEGFSKQVLSKKGQTIIDLALMETGTLEGVFDIINRLGMDITSDISEAITIKGSTSPERRFYDAQGLFPVTWYQSPEGVEYWFIDVDFIAQ
jgi:hypothetical protein